MFHLEISMACLAPVGINMGSGDFILAKLPAHSYPHNQPFKCNRINIIRLGLPEMDYIYTLLAKS